MFPYINHGANSQTTGIEVELLRKVLRSMQSDLRIVHFPERRPLFELNLGHFDIGLGAGKNKAREKSFHFSEPYRIEWNRLAYRQNDNSITNSWSLQHLISQNKMIEINLAGWYGDELEHAKRVYDGFVFSEAATKRIKNAVFKSC